MIRTGNMKVVPLYARSQNSCLARAHNWDTASCQTKICHILQSLRDRKCRTLDMSIFVWRRIVGTVNMYEDCM